MPMWSWLVQYWLWISIPLMISGLVLLVWFIFKLVRLVRKEPLANLPLVDRQEVEFPEAGRVHLAREGPRLTIWKRLKYELVGPDGISVDFHRLLFQPRTAGLTRIRWESHRLNLPRPGRYTLFVHGLETTPDQAGQHRIIFVRPSRVIMVAYIIGIIFSAALLIVSLVTFLLSLLNPGSGM